VVLTFVVNVRSAIVRTRKMIVTGRAGVTVIASATRRKGIETARGTERGGTVVIMMTRRRRRGRNGGGVVRSER
jgi:hypothetical protein